MHESRSKHRDKPVAQVSFFEFFFVSRVLILWQSFIPVNFKLRSNGNDSLLGIIVQSVVLFCLSRTERWPRKDIERLSRFRLKRILLHAENFSFWSERMKKAGVCAPFSDAAATFNNLSVLTKEDVRPYFIEYAHLAEKYPDVYSVWTTTGTTGVPMPIPISKRLLLLRRVVRQRIFTFAGAKPFDRMVTPKTRSNPHHYHAEEELRYDNPEQLVEKRAGLYEHMNKKGIRVFYTFPSALLMLAPLYMKEKNPMPKLSALISTGEHLTEVVRRLAEKAYGVSVYDVYGSIDAGLFAQECEYHEGVHINEEFYYIEVIDQNGKPLPPSETGRVVVTPLDPQIFPLIRYETGDVGHIIAKPCLCGRSLRRIVFDGRKSEFIVTSSGHILTPFIFRDAIEQFDPRFEKVIQYQIAQLSIKNVVLRVVPTVLFSAKEQAALRSLCQKMAGDEITFDVEVVSYIEQRGGKQPYFIPCPDATLYNQIMKEFLTR